MIERDPKSLMLAESEWHLAAMERRVLQAIRNRANGGAAVGDEDLSIMFDDLVEAITHHREVLVAAAPAREAVPGPAAQAALALMSAARPEHS